MSSPPLPEVQVEDALPWEAVMMFLQKLLEAEMMLIQKQLEAQMMIAQKQLEVVMIALLSAAKDRQSRPPPPV